MCSMTKQIYKITVFASSSYFVLRERNELRLLNLIRVIVYCVYLQSLPLPLRTIHKLSNEIM